MSSSQSATQGDAASARMTPYSWYVVALLTLVYAVHTMDRGVFTLLLPPIKSEFNLSDTSLGFLAGASYALAFAVAGIPMGVLADKLDRRRLLAGMIAVWSTLTAVTGFSRSFANLVTARVCVGLAEAGGAPISLSIMSEYVPQKRRSLAAGIFMSGTGLGTILALLLSGTVATAFGWRAAFFVVGLPGLLVAVLVLLTLKEPRSAAQTAQRVGAGSLRVAIRHAATQPALALVLAATVVTVFGNAALGIWIPTYLVRTFHMDLAHAGMTAAIAHAVPIFLGGLAGSYLTDLAGRRDIRGQPILAGVSVLLAAGLVMAALLAPGFRQAVVLIACYSFIYPFFHAAGFGLTTSLALPSVRGATVAILAVLNNVVGYGLGPQIAGLLSDLFHARAGDAGLKYAMLVLSLSYVVAGVLYLVSAAWLKAGLAQVEALEAAG